MRLIYDAKADQLVIRLRTGRVHHTENMEDGLVVEIDEQGRVMGFELANARRRLTVEELTTVTYENLSVGKRSSMTLP